MVKIEGSGFCLREWLLSDEVALVKYASNPRVSQFLSDRFGYPYTVEYARQWLNHQAQKTVIDNLVIDIGGELVGGIGIEFRQDIFCKTALLGYWLAEPFWGKGIMTEVVSLMVDYSFENFDLARIQAGVFDGNKASMRVLEKAGFIKEGIAKKAIYKSDKFSDEHIYALTR